MSMGLEDVENHFEAVGQLNCWYSEEVLLHSLKLQTLHESRCYSADNFRGDDNPEPTDFTNAMTTQIRTNFAGRDVSSRTNTYNKLPSENIS